MCFEHVGKYAILAQHCCEPFIVIQWYGEPTIFYALSLYLIILLIFSFICNNDQGVLIKDGMDIHKVEKANLW